MAKLTFKLKKKIKKTKSVRVFDLTDLKDKLKFLLAVRGKSEVRCLLITFSEENVDSESQNYKKSFYLDVHSYYCLYQ